MRAAVSISGLILGIVFLSFPLIYYTDIVSDLLKRAITLTGGVLVLFYGINCLKKFLSTDRSPSFSDFEETFEFDFVLSKLEIARE